MILSINHFQDSMKVMACEEDIYDVVREIYEDKDRKLWWSSALNQWNMFEVVPLMKEDMKGETESKDKIT